MRSAGDYLCDGPACDGIAADDGWQPHGWTHTQDGRDLCRRCTWLAERGELDDTPRLALPEVTAQAPAVSVPPVRELLELLLGVPAGAVVSMHLDPWWLAAQVEGTSWSDGAPGELVTESWCLAWSDLDIAGALASD